MVKQYIYVGADDQMVEPRTPVPAPFHDVYVTYEDYERDVHLAGLSKEYDLCPEDGDFRPPHPIFQMAEDIDRLNLACKGWRTGYEALRVAAQAAEKDLKDILCCQNTYARLEPALGRRKLERLKQSFSSLSKALEQGE